MKGVQAEEVCKLYAKFQGGSGLKILSLFNKTGMMFFLIFISLIHDEYEHKYM